MLYTHPRFTFNTDQRVKRSCSLLHTYGCCLHKHPPPASAQSPLPSLTQRLDLNVLVPASRSQPHCFPTPHRNVWSEPLIWSYAVRLATAEGFARLLSRYNFALGTSMVPAGCGDLFEKEFGKCGRRTFAWGCLCSLMDIALTQLRNLTEVCHIISDVAIARERERENHCKHSCINS